MSRNLNELKELFATGTYSRSELFENLYYLVQGELRNNRQKKPHGEYFHDGSYERDLRKNRHDDEKKSQIANMCKEYLHHEPSPELQEVATFACEVAKKLDGNSSAYDDNESSILILSMLAREPNLTKTILNFAKENHIKTINSYPSELIYTIVDTPYEFIKEEGTKDFEFNIVNIHLLNFIKDEAKEHRDYPDIAVGTEEKMFENLTLIFGHKHTETDKATKFLEQLAYNTFLEIAANNRQDLQTLRSAQRFLNRFLEEGHDKELIHEILRKTIPAAAKDTKHEQKNIPQNHPAKTR